MSETLTCSVCGCELDDDFYEAEDEVLYPLNPPA